MRPIKVLLVDDNAEVAVFLGDLLRLSGHEPVVARNGVEALARLAETDFDVIISDITMPELDGAGLYRVLSRDRPHYAGRVIFMTGQQDPAAVAFLDGTGVHVLRKPFSLTDVSREIQAALARNAPADPVPAP